MEQDRNMYGSRAGVDPVARRHAKARDAEGRFVPRSRWPAIRDVLRLEDKIGKPVVTSSQEGIWKAMTLIGIVEKVNGYGRSLADLGICSSKREKSPFSIGLSVDDAMK